MTQESAACQPRAAEGGGGLDPQERCCCPWTLRFGDNSDEYDATPDGQGGYTLSGQKIFITWGDHDATDNIVHLVLARGDSLQRGSWGVEPS